MERPYAREPPGKAGNRFYAIDYLGNGTADIYLMPEVTIYPIQDGFKEYDVRVLIVRGFVLEDGFDLEADIRARYEAWCESAEVIDL